MADSDLGGLTTNFIKDVAADTDFFGSHGAVATAIASVLRQNPDLKAIGLLGPWGAGKSTVIRLVQKQLEEDSSDGKTYVFAYDAWLHQNDPPRRSFLETLIYFLIEQKDEAGRQLVSENDWYERLAQLNGEIENTEITTTPTLTSAGRLVVCSLFLLPAGLAFVNYDWAHAAFGHTHSRGALAALAFGTVCLLLPLVIASGIYLSWRGTLNPAKKSFWHRANWAQHRAPYASDSIFSLFMSKGVQRQSNRVIRTPDPTTIEFQIIFREIMKAVSSAKRRFLFVIDNLDRLPETEAVAMWGTIRSFFLGRRANGNVLQLPTVIVPIDESAVRRMYSVAHAQEADELAKSFIDKTFDLTFRVTPPVLSDWSDYLARQMRSVFGAAMPAEWPFIVNRLYEKFLLQPAVEGPAIVTPRIINTLVNDIATLWLQRRHSGIRFESLAYFAIFREYIAGNIAHAVATPVAGIEYIDPDWQSSIAALHYGVEPNKAVQVLLEQRMHKAIAAKDMAAFVDMYKIRGSNQVFQRILDASASNDGLDASVVTGAALLLNKVSSQNDIWESYAWSALRMMLHRAHWRAFGPDEANAICAVIARCDVAELPTLASSISSVLAGLDEALTTAQDFESTFLIVLNGLVDALNQNKLAIPKIVVPGNAETFLGVLSTFARSSDVLRNIRPKVPSSEVADQLTSDIQNPQRSVLVAARLYAVRQADYPLPWDAFVAAAGQIVQDENASGASVSPALGCLSQLRSSVPAAASRVQQLINGGHLLQRLNEALSSNNDRVTAQTFVLFLLVSPDFGVPQDGDWTDRLTARPILTQYIDEELFLYDRPDGIVHLAEMAFSHGSLARILRFVIGRRIATHNIGSITSLNVLEKLSQYIALLDATAFQTLIQRVAQLDDFWSELSKLPFDETAMAVFRVLIHQGSGQEDVAREALATRLNEVPPETWSSVLSSGAEPLALTEALATVTPIAVGQLLYQSLETGSGALLSSAASDYRKRWLVMSSCLGSNAKSTLFKNLRDRMTTETASNLVELLALAPDDLFVVGDFASRSDGAVRHIVVPAIGETQGRQWLVAHAELAGEWIRGSDGTTQQFVAEQVMQELQSADDTNRDLLIALKSAWPLPALAVPSPSVEDDKGELAQ
jgi:hypothetical protein